jgi:hypothetical protein
VVLERQPDIFGGAGFETSARRDSVLAQRFLVPPFTVLDTRNGPWQARKRQWIGLGIQSELGRGDTILFESEQITEPGLNHGPRGSRGGSDLALAREVEASSKGKAQTFGKQLAGADRRKLANARTFDNGVQTGAGGEGGPHGRQTPAAWRAIGLE